MKDLSIESSEQWSGNDVESVAVACLKTLDGLRKITKNHGVIGPNRNSKLALSNYRSALLLVELMRFVIQAFQNYCLGTFRFVSH